MDISLSVSLHYLACAVSLPVLINEHTVFYFHTTIIDNVYGMLEICFISPWSIRRYISWACFSYLLIASTVITGPLSVCTLVTHPNIIDILSFLQLPLFLDFRLQWICNRWTTLSTRWDQVNQCYDVPCFFLITITEVAVICSSRILLKVSSLINVGDCGIFLETFHLICVQNYLGHYHLHALVLSSRQNESQRDDNLL
jgi:hypothetical protein